MTLRGHETPTDLARYRTIKSPISRRVYTFCWQRLVVGGKDSKGGDTKRYEHVIQNDKRSRLSLEFRPSPPFKILAAGQRILFRNWNIVSPEGFFCDTPDIKNVRFEPLLSGLSHLSYSIHVNVPFVFRSFALTYFEAEVNWVGV